MSRELARRAARAMVRTTDEDLRLVAEGSCRDVRRHQFLVHIPGGAFRVLVSYD